MNHGIHSFQRGLYSTIAGLKDELRKRLDQELPDLENNRLLILFNQTRFDDPTTLDHIREQFEVTEQLDMMAVGKFYLYSGVPHSSMLTELLFDVILMKHGSQHEQFCLNGVDNTVWIGSFRRELVLFVFLMRIIIGSVLRCQKIIILNHPPPKSLNFPGGLETENDF